jgi:hypothetical protein
MQRARERETLAKATANAEAQAEARKAAERWVALPEEAEASNEDDEEKKKKRLHLRERCVSATGVDRDASRVTAKPPPLSVAVTYAPRSSFVARGASARVSFGGHNKATEAMNAERRERERRARAAVAARRSRPDDVSDAEMAAALGVAKKKQKTKRT